MIDADSLATWLRIVLPRLEAFIARMPEESMEREDARRLANDLRAFCGWLEMEVDDGRIPNSVEVGGGRDGSVPGRGLRIDVRVAEEAVGSPPRSRGRE